MTRRRVAIVAVLVIAAGAAATWYFLRPRGDQVIGVVEQVEVDEQSARYLVNQDDGQGKIRVDVLPGVAAPKGIEAGQRIRAWYDGTKFITEPPSVNATRVVVEK